MKPEMKAFSAQSPRDFRQPKPGDDSLGPLKWLPGTWANIRPEHRKDGNLFVGEGTLEGKGKSPFDGRGWNLIALPFAQPRGNYRLLMNQYNEVLTFKSLDDDVPNRGITSGQPAEDADQLIAALDYEQMIAQIAAADSPESDKAGEPKAPIHHEPGFFLWMKNQRTNDLDIARLATIPHGNSATALGQSSEVNGPPNIPVLEGFPEGVSNDIAQAVADANDERPYLLPYKHFTDNPFKGVVTLPGFPGFTPADATNLLRIGLPDNVTRTTVLPQDTDLLEAGIVNIPFVVRQADAASMKAFFWIMELDEPGLGDNPKLVLAYAQFIFLDFFQPRLDGRPGLIRWPHISINMMEKIAEPDDEEEMRPVYKAMRSLRKK